jgi:hypothetical protein
MSAVTLAPKPDVVAVLAAAELATGLNDFGEGWSRESLDNVVVFLNGDAALSPECSRGPGRRICSTTVPATPTPSIEQ